MTISLSRIEAELHAAVGSYGSGRGATDALCVSCVRVLGVDGAAVSLVYDGVSNGTFGSSSEESRRLDEYQFTFGEGPCLDAVAAREAVLVGDLDSPSEQRWPVFRGAVLDEGIRGVFALPIMVTSMCVGALDLFRARPGPLEGDALAGAFLAARLITAPLLDLIAETANAYDLDEVSEPGARDDDPGQFSLELDRVEVYQASGMLIHALGVDAAEALVRLRAHAIATGQTASEVAKAIIERRLTLEGDGFTDRPARDGDGEVEGKRND